MENPPYHPRYFRFYSFLDSVGIPINLFITGKPQWQYVTSPFMHLSEINCVHCYWMFHGEPFAFF